MKNGGKSFKVSHLSSSYRKYFKLVDPIYLCKKLSFGHFYPFSTNNL